MLCVINLRIEIHYCIAYIALAHSTPRDWDHLARNVNKTNKLHVGSQKDSRLVRHDSVWITFCDLISVVILP